jgi:hypothetical protein
MASGKTSIVLLLRDGYGGFYTAQTSALIIDGLNGAIRGAEIRWKENPE